MAERIYEDLDVALSSCWKDSIDQYDYEDEDEEADEDYEDEQVDGLEKFDKNSVDLACPFCCEDFDVLGLCCHIDADHRMEVKPGICPICAVKVHINMASHVITQHDSILKALSNTQQRSARSRSAILLLRKEMQAKHYSSTQESLSVDISSDPAADSTLLSFVNNPRFAERSKSKKAVFSSSNERGLSEETSNDNDLERKQPSLSTDVNDGRASRCEFLQGLVLSTIFDDL